MPYWQLFYHFVWATKNRMPLLTQKIEPLAYSLLHKKANELGAQVFALNGMSDHVHLIVTLPPTIAISRFIGQVKGVASTQINKSGVAQEVFAWQKEYGVFSLDRKRLPQHIAYVENQRKHHTKGTTITSLEKTE